jgi:hypothetical protein
MILPRPADCRDDPRNNTIIVDDVLWLGIIVLVAAVCAWACCAWDAPPAPCRSRWPDLLHVVIEHADVPKKREEGANDGLHDPTSSLPK